MRTVFFGTPEFAVPTLAALVDAGYAPLRVVSQPARPAGRGRRLRDPPVARWARARGLEVAQPESVRGRVFRRELSALAPDVAVVVAFGQIFRRRLLELPRHGCVNLHASLLPRWRGAAPIQAAIAAGDRVTGVSTMRMDEGLDSGPVLLHEEVEIGPEETSPELAERLAHTGAALMVRTIRALETGTLEERPQDESLATYAPRLEKRDGLVDWRLPAGEIHDRLRAYAPWPGLVSALAGRPLKLREGRPAAVAAPEEHADVPPGTIVGRANDAVLVLCGGGSLFALARVQRPGRAPVSAADLLNGERIALGERFATIEVADEIVFGPPPSA